MAYDEGFAAYSCGAAAELGNFPAPHSLLIPKREPSGTMVEVCQSSSQSRHGRLRSSLDECAIFAA